MQLQLDTNYRAKGDLELILLASPPGCWNCVLRGLALRHVLSFWRTEDETWTLTHARQVLYY